MTEQENLMKKTFYVFLLTLALLLTTGCATGNTGMSDVTGDTHNTNKIDSQNIPDTNHASVETLTKPDHSYCNINGTSVTDGCFIFTDDAEYGAMFSLVCFLDGGTRSIMLAVLLPEDRCTDNVALRGDELNDNQAFIYYMDTDGYTGIELFSSQDPESFSNTEFILYDYSAKDSAVWSVKGDIATPDGTALNFDLAGTSVYISADELNLSSSSGSDGTCLYCHGSGSCSTCSGLGYWYVGGQSSCTACGGSGVCYYCEGTGIQVWLVRGVPVNE